MTDSNQKNIKNIGFCGTGQFGFAMLKHLERKYAQDGSVNFLAYDADKPLLESLKNNRKHLYIQGDNNGISERIKVVDSVDELIKESDVLIMAVNSYAINDVFQSIRNQNKQGLILVNLAKALDDKFRTYSIVAEEVLAGVDYKFAALVGGSLAHDLLQGDPLGLSLACKDAEVSKQLQDIFENGYLKIYLETDVVGVELAAALKNTVSLVGGICEGLGYDYGTVTYMIVSAAKEIAELAQKNFDVRPETFGMYNMHWGNDMWMSATGASRNRKFGELIGKGYTEEAAFEEMKTKTVESLYTLAGMQKAKDFDNALIMSKMYRIMIMKCDSAESFREFIINNKF